MYEHKNKAIKGFTAKYNISKLVYYERYNTIQQAILREKQLKGGSKKAKLTLVKRDNVKFQDLAADWF